MLGPLEMMSRYGIPVTGLLHIGANDAREAHSYNRCGLFPVLFIEPIPEFFERALRNTRYYPSMHVINACCNDVDGQNVVFNIASNNAQSSSMLALGKHQEIYPGITYVDRFSTSTARVDTLLASLPDVDMYNAAVIDTQGADLKVLRGFGELLKNFDALYVEVSEDALYEGGASFGEVIEFLADKGFALMHLESTQYFYGNALFVRHVPIYLNRVMNAVSVGKPVTQSSTYKDDIAFAAENGNNGDVKSQACFHTENEAFPWWRVDLEEIMDIRGVYVFDRPGHAGRSANLVVELGENDSDYRRAFSRSHLPGDVGRNYFIPLRERVRYVRVRLDDKSFLHLKQVAVIV